MENKKWVAGWGASISYTAQNHGDYFKDQTFRCVFFPTIDGEAIRLHFSNRFGSENATLTKANVALSLGGNKIDTETIVPITFNGGERSLTMEPGKEYISDSVPFLMKAGQDFVVNMYYADFTQYTTGHSNNGHYVKKYFSKGDMTEIDEIPLETLGENGPYVFLNTIDFLAEDDCAAIVAFGDSITAQPWPDCLAHRIFDEGIRNRAVIRRGIGGNRVLRDYSIRSRKHYGVAGIKRFEQDVTTVAGADRVFVLHGINDMLHPGLWASKVCPMSEFPTYEELTAGYKKYVDIAHKHGMKIYLATILPCPRIAPPVEGDRENMRVRVNEWIRNDSGADGVIEFEKAVMDPENPKAMFPLYDSGDHLHPSLAGAQKMADSIPEEFYKN